MKAILPLLRVALCMAVFTCASSAQTKTPISYAQLLVETVAFENATLADVAIYTGSPLTLVAHSSNVSEPPISTILPALHSTLSTGNRVALPLLATTGDTIGILALTYASAAPSRTDQSISLRSYLQQLIPKRETLSDPYMKGFDATDTLAQRINQTLVARHPDVNVIAIHITAPGDTKNKVWGINRPNFLGRDSDEIDTDTEKTGRIVMQVIPATHRMEVHMPLFAPNGKLIGTICTVYLWKTVGEAADFYGRSLGIMEEARQLTPTDRNELFKP